MIERRIEELTTKDERANLLAVSQVLAQLRFPHPELLSILGGSRVMIESPLIQELEAEAIRKSIVVVLQARLGTVPADLVAALRKVKREKKLTELLSHAAVCPDPEAFRERLRA